MNNSYKHFVSVILIVILCILGFGSKGRDKTDKEVAFITCKKYVREELKLPDSAIFPNYEDVEVTDSKSNIYEIVSYVQALNYYNEKISLEYKCSVKKIDKKKWILINLNFY